MSKPTLFNANVIDPTAAAALMEYVTAREALQSRLSGLYEDCLPVRAAWIYGSLGRGDGDDVSDVDTWLIISDEYVSGFEQQLVDLVGELG